jgi:hypothetical protein
VVYRAVRRVGDGRVGVEPGYLARYLVALAAGVGVALAVAAVAPDVVAAAAAALAFSGACFVLRLLPSELTALIPSR